MVFRCGAEKATPPPPLNLLVKIAGKLVVVRSEAVKRVRSTQICTRVPTAFIQDRTVELCPGPYGGPRGGGLFLVSEVPLYSMRSAESIEGLHFSKANFQFRLPFLETGHTVSWEGGECDL